MGVFAQPTDQLRRLLRQSGGARGETVGLRDRLPERQDRHQRQALQIGHGHRKEDRGRKRNIVIDTVVLLIAVLVTAASAQDSVAATHPTVRNPATQTLDRRTPHRGR